VTALPPWELERVSAEAMRELAVLLDDPNPIHLDPEAARRAGHGDRVVNQGPVNCSYVVSMLEGAFPEGVIRALRFRLLANVRAGDRVVAGGEVVRTEPGEDGRRVHCRVWLDVAGGPRAVEGTAEIALP
jgi:3-hydroxybutyryl-CoA dehydratase